MLIGVLSDTHDRPGPAATALRLLREQGAEFIIHCGDVGSEPVLDLLAGLPVALVWGNTDWDGRPLTRYAEGLGVRCLPGPVGELELGGKRIAVSHGDDARAMRQVLDDQRHDYLLCGHTHVANDQRVGKVRVINPGALHRARHKTVALLDTEADRVSFVTVEEGVKG